ncbi:MAG: hypothetical protein ACQCN5_12700 [Candidatus Bathyarchaeia archaeon]
MMTIARLDKQSEFSELKRWRTIINGSEAQLSSKQQQTFDLGDFLQKL